MASKKWNILHPLPWFMFQNTDPIKNESFQIKIETFNIQIAPLLEKAEIFLATNEFFPGKIVSVPVKIIPCAPTQDLPVKSGSCSNRIGSLRSQAQFSPDEAEQFFTISKTVPCRTESLPLEAELLSFETELLSIKIGCVYNKTTNSVKNYLRKKPYKDSKRRSNLQVSKIPIFTNQESLLLLCNGEFSSINAGKIQEANWEEP